MEGKMVRHRIYGHLRSIAEKAAWIGYLAIGGIVLIVFIDVCGRVLLNEPLRGSYELVEQSMGALAGFAIMYAALKGAHVALDLVTGRLSRRTRSLIESIYSLIGFATWVVIAYQIGTYHLATAISISETTGGSLRISTVPVLSMFVVGAALCSVILFVQTLFNLASEDMPGIAGELSEP